MTIDEAIEILSATADAGVTTFDDKYEKAHQLGIEALEEFKKARDAGGILQCFTLLGETEE